MTDQPLYRHHYRAIVIDPPWAFKARAPNKNPSSDRSVERHYKTMTLKEITEFLGEVVPQLADPKGCHIFFCTTGPFLQKTFPILTAMKARYSSVAFYYLKMKRKHGQQIEFISTEPTDLARVFHLGLGFTTRKNIEPILLARIGSPKRVGKDVPELIIDPLREHSRKPDELFKRVERYCEGPYLELFSRASRPGWTTWGDESTKFDGEKE